MNTFNQIWNNIYLKFIIIVAIVWAVISILGALSSAIFTIFMAFFLAYFLDPIVTKMSKFKFLNRVGSSVILMLVFFIIVFMTVIAFTSISIELFTLTNQIAPALAKLDYFFVNSAPDWISDAYKQLNSELSSTGSSVVMDTQKLVRIILETVTNVFGRIGHVFESMIQMFLLFFLALFSLINFNSIKETIQKAIPAKNRPLVNDLSAKMDITVGGYVRAKLLEALIMGVLVYITLSLLGINKALPLAFLAMMVNPLPYIGPFSATLIASLMALTTGFGTFFLTGFVMTFLEQIDSQLLAPLLVSKNVHISPVLVIISLLIGGALMGIVGMLISVPIAAFLQVIYKEYYLGSNWYKNNNIVKNEVSE